MISKNLVYCIIREAMNERRTDRFRGSLAQRTSERTGLHGRRRITGNEAIRARLDAAAAQDRFSHSYLICGPDGSGKHTLAKILAAAMQCTGAGRKPCGRCEGCRKVFEGVHPDVITVNDRRTRRSRST